MRGIYPDVRIVESEPLPVRPDPTPAAVAVAEPVVIHLRSEPRTEGYLEVREVLGETVVTTIEVLSPTNKQSGDGVRQYRQKQRELEVTGTGLVEIDLLRGGQWAIRVPLGDLSPRLRTPYRACVTRGWDQDNPLYYPIPLRGPLPTIRIPLRETDDEIPVDLQPLLDRAYRNGRYYGIDYTKDPDPTLAGEDAAWADELLRAAGRR